MYSRFAVFAVFASCLVLLPTSGCKSKTKQQEPSAKVAQPSVSSSAQTQPALAVKSQTFSIPVGPKLGILPGEGIGPIRFGATLQTIERLMEAPCTEKSATLCRYAPHAVDFHLKDGALVKIQIHGDEHPFDEKQTHNYGIFNGQFPQGAALGMYPQYVINMLGEPLRKEKIAGAENPNSGTAGAPNPAAASQGRLQERHYYKNAVLEYDRLKNGNVVLSSVILEKP